MEDSEQERNAVDGGNAETDVLAAIAADRAVDEGVERAQRGGSEEHDYDAQDHPDDREDYVAHTCVAALVHAAALAAAAERLAAGGGGAADGRAGAAEESCTHYTFII